METNRNSSQNTQSSVTATGHLIFQVGRNPREIIEMETAEESRSNRLKEKVDNHAKNVEKSRLSTQQNQELISQFKKQEEERKNIEETKNILEPDLQKMEEAIFEQEFESRNGFKECANFSTCYNFYKKRQ